MLQGKTTFVLGAGASQELNLPIGSGLTTAISDLLSIDRQTASYFRNNDIRTAVGYYLSETGRQPNSFTMKSMADLSADISSNMPIAPSIDNYLNTHRADLDRVAIGKIAIASGIINAERNSWLYSVKNGQFLLPTDNARLLSAWHISLWKTLIAGVEKDQVERIFENCRFVVFNYDRCLEHFFFLAIVRYFGVSEEIAASIVNNADIVHAYGKVGGLPWEPDDIKTPFGHADASDLHAISSEIRTFTESVNEGVQARLREMMQDTSSIVFLGFGFIDQNMALIAPPATTARRVFLTAFDMPPSEQNMALRKIGRILGKEVQEGFVGYIGANEFQAHPVYGDCRTLMAHHRLRLPDPAP